MTPLWTVTLLLTAEPYLEVRESARALLSAECGSCHIRGLKTAKEKALAVFDLTAADFASTMSPLQLTQAQGRLESDLKEDARPRTVSKKDQELFQRFIAAELERRQAKKR